MAFRWLLSISLSSLSFSLFPPEGLRTSSRTTFSAPLSPSGSLSLPFIARTCHSSPLFLSCRLSSTRFSGISPPVHRQDVPRRRGRPHVTSGYSRVKSGTRFGRTPPRALPHADAHAPFIIGSASKRMPKAAKFCLRSYYIRNTMCTNACAYPLDTFVSSSSSNFFLSSQVTVKSINVFFLIFFDTCFFVVFFFSTAPETSRLRLRKRSRPVSRPRRALPRRIGGTCVTRAKNIRYYVAESLFFKNPFLGNLQNQLALHIRSVCN